MVGTSVVSFEHLLLLLLGTMLSRKKDLLFDFRGVVNSFYHRRRMNESKSIKEHSMSLVIKESKERGS